MINSRGKPCVFDVATTSIVDSEEVLVVVVVNLLLFIYVFCLRVLFAVFCLRICVCVCLFAVIDLCLFDWLID